jgi:glycogen operon protein
VSRIAGYEIAPEGVRFSVESGSAEAIWLCLFDAQGNETRHEMAKTGEREFSLFVPGAGEGLAYGYRAEGEYAPERGLWFDPAKLLVDPRAIEIDRRYRQSPELARFGADTAHIVPRAVVRQLPPPLAQRDPVFDEGGLIYELPVKAFTKQHPGIPAHKRGTVAALAEPAVIDHLRKLRVSAVELMPVVAWIDERHLPKLGLANSWGYNPVTFMPPDPGICPGGVAELRGAVAALQDAGIGVILDLVFNHTGESDREGGTLSFRGLDNPAYYMHSPDDPGVLLNHTGCGNTVDLSNPHVADLFIGSLRHFVENCGVDGFRFDLATVLGRNRDGFRADAPALLRLQEDEALRGRILIAEPWDIGPGGYQLGEFPQSFLEWNDRYRDDVRRYWRGDATAGELATRLAGSSDIFGAKGEARTRGVSFIAAHDGFTLADLVSHERKHNEANGEQNRDGHDANHSWNNGAEGKSDDPAVLEARGADIRALLTLLFATRGPIMLCAGDEFGRSQRGNNNAYAQDNEITWLDWENRDRELEEFTFELARARVENPLFGDRRFLSGEGDPPDVEWLREDGGAMQPADWEKPGGGAFAMVLRGHGRQVAIAVNRGDEPAAFHFFDGVREVAARSVSIHTQ